MKMNIYRYIIILFVLAGVFTSCSKWDDFKKYTEDGETLYTGKLDSIVITPGYLRVKIQGVLPADPKITECKVIWTDFGQKDSISIPISKSGSFKRFEEVFEVKEEGTKNFVVQTFDNNGIGSVIQNVVGTVYGPNLESTLLNRKVTDSKLIDEDILSISWGELDSSDGAMETMLFFTNALGKKDTLYSAIDEESVLVPNYKAGSEVYFKTAYLLDSMAIDPVYTVVDSVSEFEVELNRDLFEPLFLPGDAVQNVNTRLEWGWDGDLDWPHVSFTPKSENALGPNMVTIDLGQTAKLTRVLIFPHHEGDLYYYFTTMKDFEIYGSAEYNPDGSLDDSWQLLGSYHVEKPSGLPYGEENELDMITAQRGFNWEVDANAGKVRYIRIRNLENFEGADQKYQQSFAEIYFYGDLR